MFFPNYYSADMLEYQLQFNGWDAKDFDLGVAEYPSIPRVNEDIENIEIEGRSGSLTIRKGTYKDRVLKFKFRLLDVENMWTRMDEIENWLLNFKRDGKSNRLYYDREDRFFKVKNVYIGDIIKEIKKYGEFEVTFLCEPFTYSYPKNLTTNETTFTIRNSCDFAVNPIITLKGNGNLQISINGEVVQVKNVVNEVIINSNLMLCYTGVTNKLIDMIGNFPKLIAGNNNITVSNVTETKIQYEPIYR